jgi:protein-L-isoaspartate(D-aspartate) O-methyltransferase
MTDVNFEAARKHMVESQIRTWDVMDQHILDLVARSPRQDFVPPEHRNLAYADLNIPLGNGIVMMSPRLEARLLQALDVQPKDKVLEVGTGSGYLTWLLANLGSHVYSVEIDPAMAEAAAKRLDAHGIRNVSIGIGDGASGWETNAPFDAIIITGSLPILPEGFARSLAAGGRLVAIIGTGPVMEAIRITRTGENSWTRESLLETSLPALKNARAPSRFVF